MTTPILELDGVGKTFGGIQALKQVSCTLQEGVIVALIGPNGAGKTTLVNVITGVQRASDGRVVFRGRDVTAQRPSKPRAAVWRGPFRSSSRSRA
jgi:branched-chain amino acid transport system ATP-binding protein